MKKLLCALLVLLLTLSMLFAKNVPPKREFRAVWLSTVANIDWPKSRYDSDTKKQNDLKNYLVKLKDSGVNAVLMQVRCSCDAMYKSDIEPWSYWFSGSQGQGPSTEWDPLEFAVREAHKLGMELHAWVNPYRAVVSPASYDNSGYIASSHVTKQHPEWILKFSDVWILDPGLPEVRNYITNVLMDIVTRYDLDGLHMDDYFYPYSGISTEDTATFSFDKRGFDDIHDWRRDNINLLVESVMDSINNVKPWVKWGISPFGIYKPGVPAGITGMNAYSTLYCDPIAWLAARSVDYITPQCYWPFGGGQDYGKLIPWWAEQAAYYGRHFYPGQGMYRAGGWDEGEVPRQIRLNRSTDYCDGSVFFTANDFYDNHKHTIDSLKLDLYRYPSLWPVMTWKDSIAPNAPQNIQMIIETDGSKTITWDAPAYVNTSDSGYAYIVYRSPYPIDGSDMSAALDIQFHQDHVYEDPEQGAFYYALSALDRYKLESTVERIDLDFVDPLYPAYASKSTPVELPLTWAENNGATDYTLELSNSTNFATPQQQYTTSDTSKDLLLDYQTEYFWRVKADNSTFWSPVWTFTTQLPPQVKVLRPFADREGITTDPILKWNRFEDADSYELQVSRNEAMTDLIVNEVSISDTSHQISGLEYVNNYYWRVRSSKYERWTDIMTFKTKEEFIGTLWEKSAISNTYPAYMDSTLQASGLALGTIDENDVLLILQSMGDSIKVNAVDPANGNDLPFDLNLSGISGGLHALRDIEISSDGVIYAANCAESGDTLKVYQWLDPSQPALCVYEAEDVAFRLGDHITLDGRYDDGSITIYAPASSFYKLLKLNWNSISASFEAEQISLGRMQKELASVALIPGSDALYVNSAGYTIREFSTSGETQAIMGNDTGMPSQAHSLAGFNYNDKPYLVSYSKTTESAYIIDLYDGAMEALPAGATYKLGLNRNIGAAGDVEVMDNDNGTFTIFVLGNQNGLAAYVFDAASASVNIADINMPRTFTLGQNYPNPFNPVTTIPYVLLEDAEITINIYDIGGKHVRTLFKGRQTAGSHEMKFNAADLPSGQYLCRMNLGDMSVTKKMVLLK